MDLPQFTSLKTCLRCSQSYPRNAEYWHEDAASPDGLHSFCATCRNEEARLYRKRTREGRKERMRARRHSLRLRVLTHYGGTPPRCACCAEQRWEFLVLDHINGGGHQQRLALDRSSQGIYYWVIQQGYPDGYRVLCHNCNMALGFYGFCPHERERTLLGEC